MEELPSPELLRKFLRYEPETGKLFWRECGSECFKSERDWKIYKTRCASKQAFSTVCIHKYLRGKFFGVPLKAHRVVWAIQTGEWPKDQVDHINHDRQNNQWSNLREASGAQNKAKARLTSAQVQILRA